MSPSALEATNPGSTMRRLLHSVSLVDGLLIILTILYFIVARDSVTRPLLFLSSIFTYTLLVIALRFSPPVSHHPQGKLVISTGGMVLFITCVLAATHGDRGALLNLYLLPIVTSALTLGRGPTALVVLAVLAGRVFLSQFIDGLEVLTPAYALALVAEAVPVLLVALLTCSLAADIRAAHERLQVMAESDDLTGLLNLAAFTRLVIAEQEQAVRRGSHFALMLVDVEGLKAVNDRYGHEAGNRALKAVAQALARSCRSVDLVARYGGDEFVLYISGAGPAVARAVANRIRHNVGTTSLQVGGSLHRVAVSIGAAMFPGDGRQMRDLISAAARAVEKDKESRRPLARPRTAASGTA